MEILILLSFIGLAAIFAGHYVQRKQMKQEYADYVAERAAFNASEVNSND
jgi:hypothetical protein